MKYAKPTSKTLDVTPRDTSCNGRTFSCQTFVCSGIWRCSATYWKGCSKSYSI